MKKSVLRGICLLCVSGFIMSANVFAESSDLSPDTYTTYTDENNVCATVYNLGKIDFDNLEPSYSPKPNYYKVPEEIVVSDIGDGSDKTINTAVSKRAKNATIIQIGNYAAVSGDKLKWIDKDNKEVMPYIKDSRTMVPLRFIAEELGATVSYDDETRTAKAKLGRITVEITIDSKWYKVNGRSYKLDCPAEITQDRTFVPLRVFSEAFGKNVDWIESSKLVIVTPLDYPWDNENPVEKETLSRVGTMISPLVRDLAYEIGK